jgi:hypothetical protein
MYATRPLTSSVFQLAGGHGLENEVRPWLRAVCTAAEARDGSMSWKRGVGEGEGVVAF